MSAAFRQRLFRQNLLNQDSPKFFLAKVSSFTVIENSYPALFLQLDIRICIGSQFLV